MMAGRFLRSVSVDEGPPLFGNCCTIKTGLLSVGLIEIAMAIVAVGAVNYYVTFYRAFSPVLLFVGLLVTIITTVFIFLSIKTEKAVQLLPYILWKPLKTFLQLAGLVYYIIVFPNFLKDELEIRYGVDFSQQSKEQNETIRIQEEIARVVFGVSIATIGAYLIASGFMLYIVVTAALYFLSLQPTIQ